MGRCRVDECPPVRCPACRRERFYTAPSYPCACGATVAPCLDPRTAPRTVAHRAWEEEWVTLSCPACGRHGRWPRPELGCPCGTVLWIPVSDVVDASASEQERIPAPNTPPLPPPAPPAQVPTPAHAEPLVPAQNPPRPSPPRRPFHPVAIRTARDAVTATVRYLRWLGYRDIRRADQRPTSGIGLSARGLLAQVDPSARPASLRDVECLWLTAMTDSTDCVYFSLAGYAPEARARADSLTIPLFFLDLTGTPRPVNEAADALDA
ncbi:Restriction endonuclease type IV Mrr domain-containing protein OS=Streptomyces aurantiogriseus OX=66870 GN=GCM10010251_46520 PE=4 SV=1 [Streptomyces aurantiogriseus]